MIKNKEMWELGVLAYDNTFNQTGLSFISSAEYNVLMAVLSKFNNAELDDTGRVTAIITFKEMREITGLKNMKRKNIINAVKVLLDTKVEFYMDNKYTIANLFEKVSMYDDMKEFEITLTYEMSSKIALNLESKVQYTLINVKDVSKIKSIYGKELYRLLRQFRSTGKVMIGSSEFIEHLGIDRSKYSDYKIIRDFLYPALKSNEIYFEELRANFNDGDKELPNVLLFSFKKC